MDELLNLFRAEGLKQLMWNTRCGISKIAETLLLQGIEQIAAIESLSLGFIIAGRVSIMPKG